MHSINIVLIKKSELRDFKISDILENKTEKVGTRINQYDRNPTYNIELPQNILAFPALIQMSVHKFFGDIEFAYVETDYFGGGGEQAACLYKGKDRILQSRNTHAINEILNTYGVKRINGMDEFDSINLGHYRSNSDFYEESTV